MDDLISSRLLFDKPYYSAHFMDLAMWEPYVRMVSERHGFRPKQVRPGIPGTFPSFIVELSDDRSQADYGSIVVKFFGLLFEGEHSFIVERAMGHYLVQWSLPVRSPVVLAEGQLTPEWSYLIFEGVPGVSFNQVGRQLSETSRAQVAGQMGDFMKELHTASATSKPVIPMPFPVMRWDGFIAFLETQRANCYTNHQRWKDLPAQLLEQVQDYLLPVEDLLDHTSPPHLIHADLTGDHLLGRLIPGRVETPLLHHIPQTAGADWDSLAIIDWGDSRVGNILYELVALHLDLFQADKQMLSIYLEHYRLPDFYQQDFIHKALCMVLLHQFPMPVSVYAPHSEVHTLHELAERLFGV
jgi:hypothetical protein